jgi:hypothetical protein
LDYNLGVDASTLKHVTEIINRYGKAIVLEDDIVTTKGFLNYMNDALILYENEEKVVGISGYNFPTKKKLPPTFFIKGGNNPWGWATWKRAWDHFEQNYQTLAQKIAADPELTYEFNYENSYDYLKVLRESTENDQPWDVRWIASGFVKDKYSLWPGKSLVQNIGHDATGVHCGTSDKYFHHKLADYIQVQKMPVLGHSLARKEIIKFNRNLGKESIVKRVRWRISALLPTNIKNNLKKLLD